MELTFQHRKISDRITRIFGFNSELMYLVEGDDRAVLLDTGSGFGHLKNCIIQITDKPVTVLLTHGHTDHALGASEFAEVYMNPLDEAVYTVHSKLSFRSRSGSMWADYKYIRTDQIIPPMPFCEMKPLHHGTVFYVGGEEIECFSCPGHTPGSLVMLMRRERILLLGDACNDRTFLFDQFASSVKDYRKALSTLSTALSGKYDRILLSHGDGEGDIRMIKNVIDVCDDIIEGRSDDQPFEFLGDHAFLAKACTPDGKRTDGRRGNIVYPGKPL